MNTAAPPPPPPPPPDDPFTSAGNGEYDDGGLDTGAPAVAASKGKTMVIMGGIGLVVIYMLYSIFLGGGEEEPEVVEQEPQPVVQQEFEPPPLPEEEEVPFVPPPVIEAPPVPVAPTVLPTISPEEDNALKAQMQARQRSTMMIVDAGNAVFDEEEDDNEVSTSADPNSQFAAATINNSKVKKSIATKIGDLRRVVAQGRLIQATLETAINTDLVAPIRAVVSRDVYGEAGTVPLIPVGSRLIGQYNPDITGGQSRVFVIWTRVIRPDGIDVQLGSPLVDQIGQAGVAGQVDTKFQYIFSRAVMASIVSIAFAIGSDEISPSEGESSTTSSTFGTTQSGDAASTATVNALNRLGSLTETFLQDFMDIGPTILVDQGTPVNVFVNRDLIFPAELVGTQIIN